jgi:Flp pilus assembly protein TadG
VRRLRERGQSMVEFAIVAQVFFLLVMAVYQVGIAYFDKLSLEQATRDAARKGVVNRSLAPAQIQQAAIDEGKRAAGHLDPARLSFTVTSTPNPDVVGDTTAWDQGDVLTVTSQYPYDITILGIRFKSGTLTATTSLRME